MDLCRMKRPWNDIRLILLLCAWVNFGSRLLVRAASAHWRPSDFQKLDATAAAFGGADESLGSDP